MKTVRCFLFWVVMLFSAVNAWGSYTGQCSMYVDGQERQYFIYVPDGVTAANEVPLVISLAPVSAWNGSYIDFKGLADREKFVVAILYPLNGTWNASGDFNDKAYYADDKFVSKIIDISSTVYKPNDANNKRNAIAKVDKKQVYLAGAGSGAEFVFASANTSSNVFAGYAAVCGFPMQPSHLRLASKRPVPFVLVSPENRVSPYTEANESVIIDQMVARNGCRYVKTPLPDNGNDIISVYNPIDGSYATSPVMHVIQKGVNNIQSSMQDANLAQTIWNFFRKGNDNNTPFVLPDESAYNNALIWRPDLANVSSINKIWLNSISIDRSSVQLTGTESANLIVSLNPVNTTDDKNVVWTSSDESKVTVSPISAGSVEAVVTGVAVGSATITARVGGLTSVCEVTVLPKSLVSISLDKSELEIDRGNTETLTVLYNPESTTDNKSVVWTSSDPSVVQIVNPGSSQTISIKGLKAGTSTITANVGGKTATCVVTVVAVNVSSSLNNVTVDEKAIKYSDWYELYNDKLYKVYFTKSRTYGNDAQLKLIFKDKNGNNGVYTTEDQWHETSMFVGNGTTVAKQFRISATGTYQFGILVENWGSSSVTISDFRIVLVEGGNETPVPIKSFLARRRAAAEPEVSHGFTANRPNLIEYGKQNGTNNVYHALQLAGGKYTMLVKTDNKDITLDDIEITLEGKDGNIIDTEDITCVNGVITCDAIKPSEFDEYTLKISNKGSNVFVVNDIVIQGKVTEYDISKVQEEETVEIETDLDHCYCYRGVDVISMPITNVSQKDTYQTDYVKLFNDGKNYMISFTWTGAGASSVKIGDYKLQLVNRNGNVVVFNDPVGGINSKEFAINNTDEYKFVLTNEKGTASPVNVSYTVRHDYNVLTPEYWDAPYVLFRYYGNGTSKVAFHNHITNIGDNNMLAINFKEIGEDNSWELIVQTGTSVIEDGVRTFTPVKTKVYDLNKLSKSINYSIPWGTQELSVTLKLKDNVPAAQQGLAEIESLKLYKVEGPSSLTNSLYQFPFASFDGGSGNNYDARKRLLTAAASNPSNAGWDFGSEGKDLSDYNYLTITAAQARTNNYNDVIVTVTDVNGISISGNDGQSCTNNESAMIMSSTVNPNVLVINLKKLKTAGVNIKKIKSVEFSLVGGDVFYIDNVFATTMEPKDLTEYNLSAKNHSRYGTICLPMDVAVSGASVYEIYSVDATSITISHIPGIMEAGKGYLYRPLEYSNCTIESNDAVHAVHFYQVTSRSIWTPIFNNGLMGTFEDIDKLDYGTYVLSSNKIYEVDSPVRLGKNKAYMIFDTKVSAPSTAGARFRVLGEDDDIDEITGVDDNNISKEEPYIESYYSLNGIRLSAPAKGVNIIKMSDGTTKKIIVL